MGIPEYDVLEGYDTMMIQRHILLILEQTIEEYSVTLVTGKDRSGRRPSSAFSANAAIPT